MAEDEARRKPESERKRDGDESAKAKAAGEEAKLAEDLEVRGEEGVDDVKGGTVSLPRPRGGY